MRTVPRSSRVELMTSTISWKDCQNACTLMVHWNENSHRGDKDKGSERNGGKERKQELNEANLIDLWTDKHTDMERNTASSILIEDGI